MKNRIHKVLNRNMVVFILVLLMVLVFSAITLQAQTPMPTFYIPVNEIVTSANTWGANLAPVLSIGLGASLAVTVILVLGSLLIMAIRSALTYIKGGKV